MLPESFTLLCKGCGRRIVEAGRIGEEEEATAAAHVAGVLRTPRHPAAPGSLVDVGGRSGGLTARRTREDEGDRAVVYLGEPIHSGYVLRGGRQTGRVRLHIRGGSQLAPSDVKLQGAVSFTNDLHFHSNLRPAVPGHLDDAGAVEGPASREPSVSGVRRGPSASRVRTTSPCARTFKFTSIGQPFIVSLRRAASSSSTCPHGPFTSSQR